MAPHSVEALPTAVESISSKTNSPASSASSKLAPFRRLVPLVTAGDLTYINASFNPPSNLVVHEAMTRYCAEALQDPIAKSKWQATAQETRELVARYIKTDSSNVALTRDTTEGLGAFAGSLKFKPGDNVVILDSEHPNHAYTWMSLRAAGLEVRQVPSIADAEKTGKVVAADAATFAPFVNDRTIAIGLSSIMFHSGQRNDIKDIASTFRPKGIQVLVDMTQQVGFAAVDVHDLGVSAAAFGFHKGLNCPTGIAGLYVDPKVIPELNRPPIVGYGAVENVRADLLVPADQLVFHPNARRFEHLNVSLIGAAAANSYLKFYLDDMKPEVVEEHLYTLGDALRQQCKTLGVRIVGPEDRKGHAPHLYILDLQDTRWHDLFKERKVHLLPYRLGVRVSFGWYNNLDDLDVLVRVLKEGVDAGLPH